MAVPSFQVSIPRRLQHAVGRVWERAAAVVDQPVAVEARGRLRQGMIDAVLANDFSLFSGVARSLGIPVPDATHFHTWSEPAELERSADAFVLGMPSESQNRLAMAMTRTAYQVHLSLLPFLTSDQHDALTILSCASRTFRLRALSDPVFPLLPDEDLALHQLSGALQPHLAAISALLVGFLEGNLLASALGQLPASLPISSPSLTLPQIFRELGEDAVRTLRAEPLIQLGAGSTLRLRPYMESLIERLSVKGLSMDNARSVLVSAVHTLSDHNLRSTPLTQLLLDLGMYVAMCDLRNPEPRA